jgi:hypothetical protein
MTAIETMRGRGFTMASSLGEISAHRRECILGYSEVDSGLGMLFK